MEEEEDRCGVLARLCLGCRYKVVTNAFRIGFARGRVGLFCLAAVAAACRWRGGMIFGGLCRFFLFREWLTQRIARFLRKGAFAVNRTKETLK